MGWSYCHASHYKKNGQVDRKAEVDKLYTWESEDTKVEVLKSCLVSTDYFAAILVEDKKTSEKYVECVRCLTAGMIRDDPYFNFGYKSVPHTDSYNCPKVIIDLLSDTKDEKELEWREQCLLQLKKPKLSELPVGSVISFKLGGEDFVLTKMAPNYQFKRTWWYSASTNKYMPSRRIPDDWKRIS